MRVTTVFNRLLALPGISVRGVSFAADTVELTVALRRKRLVCPLCDYATAAGRDTRRVSSRWRHLDLDPWRVQVRAELRRIGLDADQLDGLVEIGVDEVSWKRQHNYLTLVTDHRRGKIVWGTTGTDTAVLDPLLR